MSLIISPELQSLIPPLTDEELGQLRANLLKDGCLAPLVVWQETQILLDGHHRLQICEQHDLSYSLQEISLPDLDAARLWMVENQLGRRNLNAAQMSFFRGEKYNLLKSQGKRTDLTFHQSDGKSHSTAQILADEFKVGPATVERDGAFAAAVDTLATVVGPEARKAVLSGDLPLPRQDVSALASLAKQSPETGTKIIEAFQSPEPATNLKAIVTAAKQGDGTAVYSLPNGDLANATVGNDGWTTYERVSAKQLTLVPEEPAANEAAAPATWPHNVSSGDYEWHTPDEILIPVRKVLGEIHLDPASCDAAQARVRAREYYTVEDDGLSHAWHGKTFLNPPYKLPEIERFCGKLVEEINAGHVPEAILVTNNPTHTDWFQFIAPHAAVICFPDGKIGFIHATHDGMSPCQGQAIMYFGPNVERFCEVFAELGLIMEVRRAKAAGPQLELADAPKMRRGKGELELEVFQAVERLGSCTASEVCGGISGSRQNTHVALKKLVDKGRLAKEGSTYRVHSLD
jgi:hypothetical protein